MYRDTGAHAEQQPQQSTTADAAQSCCQQVKQFQLVLIHLKAGILPCAGTPPLRRPALPKAAAPTFRALAGIRQQPGSLNAEQQPSERVMRDGEAHAVLQVQLQEALHRAPGGQSMQHAPLNLPHGLVTTSNSTSASAKGVLDVQQSRPATIDGTGRPAVGLGPSLAAQQQPAPLGQAPVQAGHLAGMVACSAGEQGKPVPDGVQNLGKPVATVAAPTTAAEPSTVDSGRPDFELRWPGSAKAQQPQCNREAPLQVGSTAAVQGIHGGVEAQQVMQTHTASHGSRKRRHNALGPASAPPAPGSSRSEPRGQVQAASNKAERRSARSTRAAGPATATRAGMGEAASQAESGSDCSLSGSDDVTSSEREASSTEGEEVLPKRRRKAAAGPTAAELRAR